MLLCVVSTLAPAVAHAEIAAGVNGRAADGEFSGTFMVQRFVSDGSRLLAQGVLTDVPGGQATLGPIRIPVTAMSRSCATLRIDLAQMDVVVLGGRTIHVNDFAVQVSDPGSGPLGKSLCSVANAPDDVSALVPVLNELLDVVGCLMRGGDPCARRTTRSDNRLPGTYSPG